jgi:hypothetical protein
MLVGMPRIVLACVLLVASVALAAPQVDEDDDAPPAAPSAEPSHDNLKLGDKAAGDDGDSYHGVAPGAHALPPRAPRLPIKRGPQRMTWSGFQVKDGVPTVFVETTALPDYRVEELPGMLVVTLKHTVVPLRNNRRPLDVSAFGTGVRSVEMAAHGHDLRVVIKTRGTDRPEHHERVEDAAGGFRMLVIALPQKS